MDLAVALGWDDGLGALFDDPFYEMIGIVSLVSNGNLSVDAIDQVVGKSDVVALTGRTDQAKRKAERLGGGVDFGRQAAARPAQALGMRPPFVLRAPAAC